MVLLALMYFALFILVIFAIFYYVDWRWDRQSARYWAEAERDLLPRLNDLPRDQWDEEIMKFEDEQRERR